jgi:tricorn protease
MQYPAISNDGRVAFTYHGDIWITDPGRGNAKRLTVHVAHDTHARFSPDGRWVAFTSNRAGSDDAWIIPVEGGEPRRLTLFSGGDRVVNWTPEGEAVIVSTSRGTHPFLSPLHRVPLDGSIPTPYPIDAGRAGMVSPDGSLLAYNRTSTPPTTRKGYRGNSNADIWVADLRAGADIRQLTDTDVREFRSHAHDGYPMWGADGMIYFTSERDGTFNLWRIPPEGGAPAQVTSYGAGGVFTPSISPDGQRIVYSHDFDLWTLDVPEGQPRRLSVTAVSDPKHNQITYLEAQDDADGFAPAPDGKSVAVDFHGEIFLVPSQEELGEKTRVTRSAWRDRGTAFSPDGTKLVYISDESLEDEVWVYDLASAQRRRLTTHESRKSTLLWSPDSKQLAIGAGKHLLLVDVESGDQRELGFNEAGGYNLSSWSADGNWLVYGRSDESQNSEVYLFHPGSGREINVTHSLDRERGGWLTPDGKQLVFTSNRDGGTNHLFAVSLARLTEDPDDPLVRARESASDGSSGARRGRTEEGTEEQGTPPTPPLDIQVDEGEIDLRARQLTSGENGVGTVFLSKDGQTIYFTGQDDEGPGLFTIGIDGRNRSSVTAGSFGSLQPTPDRRWAFYSQRGQSGGIFRMSLDNPQRRQQVEFNFTVEVDHVAEWRQIFEESWRTMKYRFYDENMHGKDWAGLREQYLPYLEYVGSNEEVYELAFRMIGELNASHTGVRGPPSVPAPEGPSTRYLGLELKPDGERYRVTHVHRFGPADKEWIDVEPGDYVLALNGVDLKTPENYWKRLTGMLNEYVSVRIADSPDGRNARDVRIQTASSINKYEEWVADNRDYVEEQTGGELAYVHIRSMNQSSLRRFEQEVNRYWDRKGIVIDIRYNGGGNIDEQLIDIIERRPYNHVNPRSGARTWGRRPRQAIAGPKVMMINYRSFSDAEATPMAFKTLGLGRLVGNPTGGGVIWTGSSRLINGASIRTPFSLAVTWDPTKPNNYGINLENYGVEPDVWVENTPEDEMAGRDPELDAAIAEVQRMLREQPYQFGGGEAGTER